MRRTLFALALSAIALSVNAADWPQFRGPGGNSVSSETGIATKWSKTEGIRYKIDLPGRGLSNPVIAGGRIFVTASSGYREKRLHVLAFDEKTGKKLWERQFSSTGNTACHPMTNMAAPTPVTDGKAVYALFATGDLVGLGVDGSLLWYRSLVSDYPDITNQVGMASSPVLADGVLCVPMDNAGDSFAAGIDPRTGKNLWKEKRAKAINWVTPLVFDLGGKPAVLFQSNKEATAYDPKTGKVRWVRKGGFTTIPSPVKGEGKLFLTGGQVRAFDTSAAAKEEPLWEKRFLADEFASPIYHDGKLYGVTGAAAVCIDAKDGTEVWKQRIDGKFDASPIVADGKLYAVNRAGRTFVVKLGEKPELVSRNDLEDTILATPAVANGCLYLRSDKHLYCIGPKK